MKKIVAAALAVLALLGCEPKEPRRSYIFPDFDSVKVVETDPVAFAARKFFDSYQRAVKDDASNSMKYFMPAYDGFAAEVRPYVELPIISMLEREAAIDANARLNAYLAPKGWLFRIADTYASDAVGEPIVIRMLMMGRLHSIRRSSVVDVRGKKVSYTETIVAEAKQTRAKEKSFRFTAFTEDTEIYHFLDGLEWSAKRVIADCRDGASEGAEFAQMEWAGYLQDGTTKRFEARVMSDLLRSASTHERQHVVDHEFASLRLVKGDVAVAKVKLLMEVRGLLAQIAIGGIEVYGLGHAFEWQDSSETINRLAGWAVVNAIGRLPSDPDLRGWLRRRAVGELKTSDQMVLSALRHKDDPDPVDRAKKEHEKNR